MSVRSTRSPGPPTTADLGHFTYNQGSYQSLVENQCTLEVKVDREDRYGPLLVVVNNRLYRLIDNCHRRSTLLRIYNHEQALTFGCTPLAVVLFNRPPINLAMELATLYILNEKQSFTGALDVTVTVATYGCHDSDKKFKRCPNNQNLCIPIELFCDTIDNCGGMADETDDICHKNSIHQQCQIDVENESAENNENRKKRASLELRFALNMSPFILILSLALYLTIDTATTDANNRKKFVEFFNNYYQITPEEADAMKRSKPSFFSIKRWSRRKSSKKRQGTADLVERTEALDCRRRDKLWELKDDPTESEEEEMAAVVRAIRQQRKARCGTMFNRRYQGKQSIFAPLIVHMPTTTTAIQFRSSSS